MATALVGFDPATYDAMVSTPFTLGAEYEYQGRMFRFVGPVATAACADGVVMCWYAAGTYGVIGANRTTALSGTPVAIDVAGVGVGPISIGNYGFILVKGRHTNVLSTATTLQRRQCASGTNDTCTDCSASPTRAESPFGKSLTSTSGGRCTVEVNI